MAYGLALRLKTDIDVVMDWPFEKIHGWMAYLTWADRQSKR